jgi:hypothetical protein|tara:strand:- start:1350 stop:1568 length:219 start_codon:yes stop_codon:yes gene_type:complete
MIEERLNFKIKQLETNLDMERQVKNSEKLMNEGLKKEMQVKNIQIQTLSEVNWNLVNKVADLQQQLSKFYGL